MILPSGEFDWVFDVGGNVGDWAAQARARWPLARITSFEPIAELATENKRRARGLWWVEQVALSNRDGSATLHVCLNQPSASTLQQPGNLRAQRFGIRDRFEDREVPTRKLSSYLAAVPAGARVLVKVDVEGHELRVLGGLSPGSAFAHVRGVIVEVNQAPGIFAGSPSPAQVDRLLRSYGLEFAGVLGAQLDPAGELVQFDGYWRR